MAECARHRTAGPVVVSKKRIVDIELRSVEGYQSSEWTGTRTSGQVKRSIRENAIQRQARIDMCRSIDYRNCRNVAPGQRNGDMFAIARDT